MCMPLPTDGKEKEARKENEKEKERASLEEKATLRVNLLQENPVTEMTKEAKVAIQINLVTTVAEKATTPAIAGTNLKRFRL